MFAAAALIFSVSPAAIGQVALIPHHELQRRLGGVGLNSFVDLVTPFAVVGAAAALIALLRPPGRVLVLAIFSAVAYVSGHGIHLAANSLAVHRLSREAERTIFFWDERFGHIEWHTGWLGLLLAIVLADRLRAPVDAGFALVSAALLGAALAGASIEGQTWWLVLAAAPVFWLAAWRRRGHVATTVAGSLAVAVVGIVAWAAFWGGMPQPTDVLEVARARVLT